MTPALPPSSATAVPDTNPKQSEVETKVANYEAEEFPALAPPSAPSSTHVEKKEVKPTEGKGKGKEKVTLPHVTVQEGVKSADDKAPKIIHSASKRQHPGKLDIAAATEANKEDLQLDLPTNQPTVPATSVRNTRSVASTTSALFRSSTPGVSSARIVESPVARQTQPKTIRVVRTPKTEMANPTDATSSTLPAPLTAALTKSTGRQANAASMNIPSTPASEVISDNASMTSASMSRPGSPVLGKIGSAPTRAYTKNQQKKQRKERAKIEETKKLQETFAKPVTEEPVQAPIIGRKKKAKKAASSIGGGSTPAISRPSSPSLDEQGENDDHMESKPSSKGKKKEDTFDENSKDTAASDQATAGSIPMTSQNNAVTAASIIADLQRNGEIDPSANDLFKGIVGLNHRYEFTPAELEGVHYKPSLTKEDEENLAKGLPVHISNLPGRYPSRTMISRQGRFLHGLTPEQEQRYLELEERDMKTKDPFRFNPPTENAFAALGPRLTIPPPHRNSATTVRKTAREGLRREEVLEILDSFILVNPWEGQSQYDASDVLAATASKDVSEELPTLDTSAPTYSVGSGMPEDATPEELEEAIAVARKETEAIEKKLIALSKKNRKLMQEM